MHPKRSRRRPRRRGDPRVCAICGQLVTSDFVFDVHEDGRVLVHPDCFAYEHSGSAPGSTVPDRKLPPGKRPVHTCGNPYCLNPAHLAPPEA